MSSETRIQQIINHERSISRSLPPFGLVVALAAVALLAVMLTG
jgi:hypothetical protein